MYFLHIYEFGTLKPVEVILRKRKERGRIMEEMNQGIFYTYMEMKPPILLLYTNKKIKKELPYHFL
jgi:hypothetical protein